MRNKAVVQIKIKKKNQINKNPLPKKKANRKKTNPNSKYS